MRYLLVLLLAGCASPGNTCIATSQKVGDLIMNANSGKHGVVTHIYGTDAKRCPFLTQPVIADVKY